MFNRACAFIGAMVLIFVPSTVRSQSVVDSERSGWVDTSPSKYQSVDNGPLYVGFDGSYDTRGYIVFSVPSSSVSYTSAIIRLNVENVWNGPNDLIVHGVDVSLDGNDLVQLYNNLGSGASFGSISNLSDAGIININLNSAGIAAVNAARGHKITFGFVMPTHNSDVQDAVLVPQAGTKQLVLTPTAAPPIPTLSEWAMILLGLSLAGGAALVVQRRRAVV